MTLQDGGLVWRRCSVYSRIPLETGPGCERLSHTFVIEREGVSLECVRSGCALRKTSSLSDSPYVSIFMPHAFWEHSVSLQLHENTREDNPHLLCTKQSAEQSSSKCTSASASVALPARLCLYPFCQPLAIFHIPRICHFRCRLRFSAIETQ